MNKFFYLLFLLGISFVFTTCLDEIELAAPTSDALLTVSGNIYDAPGPYTVTLQQSARFSSGSDGVFSPVDGAVIKLVNDLGETEILTELPAGEYVTSINGMRGTVGRTYHLEIEVDGQSYQSKPEYLHPVISPESITIELAREPRINIAGNFVDQDIINFFVNTPLSSERSFLKWNAYGIYEFWEIGLDGRLCYVTEDIDLDKAVVVDTENVVGDFLRGQKVNERTVNDKFASRYCINVIQQSITEDAYKFWSAVASEFERNGGIFETPPGKIQGNIYNVVDESIPVLGYFSASAADTIRRMVVPAEVGIPRPLCRFNRREDVCTNCLLIANSTQEKPACWQ